MLVTPAGIVTLVKPQDQNAPQPMLVTESGIVTEVMPPQYWNAASPMLVTESGIVTEVMPLQLQSARLPMPVTVLPPSVDGIVSAPVGSGETAVVPSPGYEGSSL